MTRFTRVLPVLLCVAQAACNDKVDTGLSGLDVPEDPVLAADSATTPELSDADVARDDADTSDASVGADTPDAAPPVPVDLTGIPSFAVHVSEYGQATGVTLIDGEGALVRALYLSSGMELPGISAALASDIALPSSPCDPALITVIGRQGTNNVLQVDYRKSKVVRQFATQRAASNATGAYQSNPQDVLCLEGDRALVSRANPNLLPGADALDLGDDLVLIDVVSGEINERLALDAFRGTVASGTTAELAYARPGSIVRRGKFAVLGLNVYSQSYVAAVPGKVAILNLETFASAAVAMTKLGNCGLVVPAPDREDAVIVSCAGSPYGDPLSAGLAYITLDGLGNATLEAEFQHAVSGAALYASPTALGGSRVLAVSVDPAYVAPDVAYVVDVLTGTVEKAFDGSEAGGVGSGAMRWETGLVLVPDSGEGVRVFQQTDGVLEERDPIALDKNIPARTVRPLRAF